MFVQARSIISVTSFSFPRKSSSVSPIPKAVMDLCWGALDVKIHRLWKMLRMKTYETQRQLNDAVSPVVLVNIGRLLRLKSENEVIRGVDGLLHSGSGIGVCDACLSNIAAHIDVR